MKKKSIQKFMPYVMSACMLAMVASCGSNDDDDNNNRPPQQEEQAGDEGVYRATLQALNGQVAGNPTGTADISISGDIISVNVNMTGTNPNTAHLQNLFVSDSCPTSAQDLNRDGFIDVLEGIPSYGGILIPLDQNIETQTGFDTAPPSDAQGNYTYSSTGSLSRMLGDLRAPDSDPTDPVFKLRADEDLNLENRVIVIHGVSSQTDLPNSVGTVLTTARQTLPIACGRIQRVTGTGTTGGTTGTTTGGATGGTTGTTTGGTTTGI